MASGPRKEDEDFKAYRKRVYEEGQKDHDFLKGKRLGIPVPGTYRQHPLFWNSPERGTYRRMK